jgi:hypothetical protein
MPAQLTDRIEATHGRLGISQRRHGIGFGSHVERTKARLRAELGCSGVAFFGIDVEQGNRCAMRDQMARDGESEPGCPAGDHGFRVLKLHARGSAKKGRGL